MKGFEITTRMLAELCQLALREKLVDREDLIIVLGELSAKLTRGSH